MGEEEIMTKIKCNHTHYCPEWDYCLIQVDSEEMKTCLCWCGDDCEYQRRNKK